MPLRTVAFVLLLAMPVLLFAVAGGVLATQHGWIWPLSIASTVCFLLAGALRFLPAAKREASPLGRLPEQPQWTQRDRDAASVVAAHRQRTAQAWESVDLTQPEFYVNSARELAADLARIYHPREADPLDALAVPEVLAAIRLAVDDLEAWVHRSIPRPRTWTIRRLRQAQAAAGFAPAASAAWYLLGAVRDPSAVLRWGMSRSTSGPLKQAAARELTVTASAFYLSTLGGYLIELYAGRLRAGADAWREAFGPVQRRLAAAAIDAGGQTERPSNAPTITIALVGQTSAGKSSLVNAIVGEAVAEVDTLPRTADVQRHRARLGDTPVVLLDTPGYGDAADRKASKATLESVQAALVECDAALVVMAAHAPGKAADAAVLEALVERFARERSQPLPPLVGVLTHIDRLPPPRDQPPYELEHPSTPKERAIAGAVEYVEETLGAHLVATVPVVAEAGRLWNVDAGLLPALLGQLDEARQVALMRGFARVHAPERWQAVAGKAGRLLGDVAKVWLRNQLTGAVTGGGKAGAKTQPPGPPA